VRAMGGTGGVIVAAPDGSAAWHFTTPGMYRARLSSEGGREISVFED
jgi:beta-aspartyl-peptidase (threonine type)